MSILKYVLVFTNLIIWGISPANAQSDNPCPIMINYQISFTESDINFYKAPNVNSQIIAEIPAGKKFSLSDIYPEYYDDFCWYKVVTFSADERGWIGFKSKGSDETNNTPDSYDNAPPASYDSTDSPIMGG